MTDTRLKMQLEKATVDLDKTSDVEGILIVASDGRILHHNLRVDVDINLFGPMSQVISNSSLRLLNSSGQGKMERVLVESLRGKTLFLGLENVHLIILMQDSANVGMVRVNAKRASQKIQEVTRDLELEVPEEIPIPEKVPVQEEIPVEGVPIEDTSAKPVEIEESTSETVTTEEIPTESVVADESTEIVETSPEVGLSEEPVDESVATEGLVKEPVLETTEKIAAESIADVTEPTVTEEPPIKINADIETDTKSKIDTETVTDIKTEIEKEIKSEVETKDIAEPVKVEDLKVEELKVETEPESSESGIEEVKPSIPSVRPPISFPSLPEHVEIPDDPEKRSDLILNIYESIFLAMSMGAAKIMGVAPARGLTKKFLPFEKCKRLLENVDLKSNATINFAQIKKNANEIPLPEREEIFIQDFNRMIEVITENYGRVMGYEAFRAMVRPEFLEIKKSYGEAMDKLNIKKSMHPEIAQLFT
jgi:predicted regulator of Ras-like GTPase activity (Roadblock/LC7/MglB family)